MCYLYNQQEKNHQKPIFMVEMTHSSPLQSLSIKVLYQVSSGREFCRKTKTKQTPTNPEESICRTAKGGPCLEAQSLPSLSVAGEEGADIYKVK